MNDTFHNALGPDDQQRQIDRLVDGELAFDARRSLLKSLDATPGAWRACALAFVESQSLGQELTAIAGEAAPRDLDLRPAVQARDAAKGWLALAASALAASVLVAFGLGTVATDWLAPGLAAGPAPTGLPAAGGAPSGPAAIADDASQVPAIHPPVAVDQSLLADGSLDDESLTLWVEDRQGGRRSLTAPLVDAATLDREHGLTFPSAVTAQVRQDWEGRGYQLSSRQRYAPLYLGNGQPLVVPVEDVQIVPVSGTAL